jgi:threonine synthase
VTDITHLVGNTPLVRLKNVTKGLAPGVEVLGKAEFFNPGGSVKDRAALGMIRDGERRGRLTPGKTIIDASSGNTGIAYAWIGGALGLPRSHLPARKRLAGAQAHFEGVRRERHFHVPARRHGRRAAARQGNCCGRAGPLFLS